MTTDNLEFIHIPKNGGTSILANLSKIDSVKFNVDRDHQTALQMAALLENFESKFSFAIVRNPFDRMVSIWQYELKRALEQRDEIFLHMQSFDAWVFNRLSSLDWNRAYMILPQWHWISDFANNQLVTKYWKYEEYNDCLSYLKNEFQLEIDFNIRLNTAMKKFNYKDISSSKTKKYLEILCALDCERFNYEW